MKENGRKWPGASYSICITKPPGEGKLGRFVLLEDIKGNSGLLSETVSTFLANFNSDIKSNSQH